MREVESSREISITTVWKILTEKWELGNDSREQEINIKIAHSSAEYSLRNHLEMVDDNENVFKNIH